MIQEYKITPPAISSGGIYLFTTDSGIHYEVRFGRMQQNILMATVVFGVTNDEYAGEEYTVTNRGELYRVMATVIRIMKMFMSEHPTIISYEVTGLAREKESGDMVTTRTKLYYRYAGSIFGAGWKIEVTGDKLLATRSGA